MSQGQIGLIGAPQFMSTERPVAAQIGVHDRCLGYVLFITVHGHGSGPPGPGA